VAQQEFGDRGDQAFAVGAGNQQNGSVRHGRFRSVWALAGHAIITRRGHRRHLQTAAKPRSGNFSAAFARGLCVAPGQSRLLAAHRFAAADQFLSRRAPENFDLVWLFSSACGGPQQAQKTVRKVC
jgi:hypothetical protein